MNAPAKFSSEARPIATRGGRARVEIDVATTLAVSWNPLVKSNASAVPTTRTKITSLCIALPLEPPPSGSRVLDDDALEDVRDPLGRVDRVLEALVDVLPADHDHRVDPVVEQRRHRLPRDAVAVVLEPVDLDRVVREIAEAAQPWHGRGHRTRRLKQDVRQP